MLCNNSLPSPAQAKKQNAEFENLVAKESAYQHINERKRKRGEGEGGGEGAQTEAGAESSGSGAKGVRKFRLMKPMAQKGDELDRNRVSKKLVQSVFSSKDA